jgi:hypothetical protein
VDSTRAATLIVTALFACFALETAHGADQNAPAASGDRPEEFVVTAKALEDLRIKIRLAEDEVYARFNDINSNDSYDIHCYDRVSTGTRVPARLCVSNAWRQLGASAADATVRGMQSQSAGVGGELGGQPTTAAPLPSSSNGYGSGGGQYRANQMLMERLVIQEFRQLAHEDPALHDAVMRLGADYQELDRVTGTRHPEWTLYREVIAGEAGLPFGARHLTEVRVGEVAWNHPLTTRTFTIGSVTGRVKGLRVQCAGTYKNLAYMEAVEWNVPEAWSDCSLVVRAKPGTTFALYEF